MKTTEPTLYDGSSKQGAWILTQIAPYCEEVRTSKTITKSIHTFEIATDRQLITLKPGDVFQLSEGIIVLCCSKDS